VKINFENDARYITAYGDNGKVEIRCRFEVTDCGETENLDSFTTRHGGVDATAEYLKECHRAA
jgi:hypothetical protein